MNSANAGPIDRINKRIAAVRKLTKPKALRDIKKRLNSLKPKKLKVGKPLAVTGSKLLRPKARAKGASVLLPGAL